MDPVHGIPCITGKTCIPITRELVGIPSVSREPSDMADHIARKVGGDIHEFPVRGAPFGKNVVAISEPHPGLPFILLNGHHDTVAPAGGWTTDPFEPLERNGMMYGLGASDMKAGTAINICLFLEFRNRINLIFTSSDDEESDSVGTFALLDPDHGPLSPYLHRIRGAVITEPTNERIMLGARGRYALHLTVHGKAAHGARPHLGVNAIHRAAALALRLARLPMDTHPQLGTGSVCTLSISGGTRTLSVPDRCDLLVDRHYTRPMSGEEVIHEFAGALVPHEHPVDIRLAYREVPFLKPYAWSPEEHFVRGFMEGIGAGVMGRPEAGVDADPVAGSRIGSDPGPGGRAEAGGTAGHTGDPGPPGPPVPPEVPIYGASVGDFNIFGGLMPTVVFGTTGRNHHAADESVEVASIHRVFERLSRWLCSVERTIRDPRASPGPAAPGGCPEDG